MSGRPVLPVVQRPILRGPFGAPQDEVGGVAPAVTDGAVPSSIAVSALTGAGLPELLATIQRHVETALAPASQSLITRERHKLAFQEADASLDNALKIGLEIPELAGEELRRAARALERVAGRINVEDVLDEIFSSLCVGK